MNWFVVVYRFFALGIIAFWLSQIVIAARQPSDWRPPRADTFPVKISRNRYIAAGVLGIIAGATVFVGSYVLFPSA